MLFFVGCVSVKFPRSEGDFIGQKYAVTSRCSVTFYQSCKGEFLSDCLNLFLHPPMARLCELCYLFIYFENFFLELVICLLLC